MQHTVTTAAVLAALLAPTAQPVQQQPDQPLSPAPTAQQDALPSVSRCPAYLGPQCDSAWHEQYASGQAIAALAWQS